MENLRLKILSEEDVKMIDATTMKVFMDPGIYVDSQEARDVYRAGGCIVDDETKIVKIPEEVARKAMSTIPPEFTLYSRDGKHNVEWKSDGSVTNNNTFGIGSSIIEYRGHDDYIRRPSTLKDLEDIIKILDYCDNVQFATTPVSAIDLADDPIRTLEEMRVMLYNSPKPLDFDSEADFFETYFEITKVIYDGDEEKAFNQPIMTVAGCPTSPLMLDSELTNTCIKGPKYGFPLSMTSMAMSGASSPVFHAGTLVIHNAEVLSALILAQLANPGCKCIYGHATTLFDIKGGTCPVGCPEIAMYAAGVAALTQYYHIPCMVAGGTTDAKQPSVQAGLEKVLTLYPSMLAGPSTIFGPGIMDLAGSHSKEQLLIDNEIVGLIKIVRDGIKVDETTLAYESIKEVGNGNDYIAHIDTIMNFEKQSSPLFMDRLQYGQWSGAGKKDAADLAHERVVEITSQPPRNPMPEEQRKKIDAIIAAKKKELSA